MLIEFDFFPTSKLYVEGKPTNKSVIPTTQPAGPLSYMTPKPVHLISSSSISNDAANNL